MAAVNDYDALVIDPGNSAQEMALFDVTTPASPSFVRYMVLTNALPTSWSRIHASGGDLIALTNSTATSVSIYTAAAIVGGGAASKVIASSAIYAMTSDGSSTATVFRATFSIPRLNRIFMSSMLRTPPP